MSIVTHNTILTNLREIATSHKQINSFGSGHISDIATSGVTDYVQMWVEPLDSTFSTGAVVRSYNIYILDRCFKDQSNVDEVISDAQFICGDIIAQLDSPQVYEFTIEKGSSFTLETLFPDWGDEELGGCRFQISIKMKWDRDRCAIPFDTTITHNSINGEVAYILNTNGVIIATVALGGTYTVSSLAGTINVYLDGVLNQTISTNDFATETVNISI